MYRKRAASSLWIFGFPAPANLFACILTLSFIPHTPLRRAGNTAVDMYTTPDGSGSEPLDRVSVPIGVMLFTTPRQYGSGRLGCLP